MKFKLDINVKLDLTWSKIIALVILILVSIQKDVSLMMFAIPFIVGMIMGKQFFDGYFGSIKNQFATPKPKLEDE